MKELLKELERNPYINKAKIQIYRNMDMDPEQHASTMFLLDAMENLLGEDNQNFYELIQALSRLETLSEITRVELWLHLLEALFSKTSCVSLISNNNVNNHVQLVGVIIHLLNISTPADQILPLINQYLGQNRENKETVGELLSLLERCYSLIQTKAPFERVVSELRNVLLDHLDADNLVVDSHEGERENILLTRNIDIEKQLVDHCLGQVEIQTVSNCLAYYGMPLLKSLMKEMKLRDIHFIQHLSEISKVMQAYISQLPLEILIHLFQECSKDIFTEERRESYRAYIRTYFSERTLDKLYGAGYEWEVILCDPKRYSELSAEAQAALLDKCSEKEHLPYQLLVLEDDLKNDVDITPYLKKAFHAIANDTDIVWGNRKHIEELIQKNPDHYAWCDEEMNVDMACYLEKIRDMDWQNPDDFNALISFLKTSYSRNHWLCHYLMDFHPCPGDENELVALVIETLFEKNKLDKPFKIMRFLSFIVHPLKEGVLAEEKRLSIQSSLLHCLTYTKNKRLQDTIVRLLETTYPAQYKKDDWTFIDVEGRNIVQLAAVRLNQLLLNNSRFFPDTLTEDETMVKLIQLSETQRKKSNEPLHVDIENMPRPLALFMSLFPKEYRLYAMLSTRLRVNVERSVILNMPVITRCSYFNDLLDYPNSFKLIYNTLTPNEKMRVLTHSSEEASSFISCVLHHHNNTSWSNVDWMNLLFKDLSSEQIDSLFFNENGKPTKLVRSLASNNHFEQVLLTIPSLETIQKILLCDEVDKNALLRSLLFDKNSLTLNQFMANKALYEIFKHNPPMTYIEMIIRLYPKNKRVGIILDLKHVISIRSNCSLFRELFSSNDDLINKIISSLEADELKQFLSATNAEGKYLLHEYADISELVTAILKRLTKEDAFYYLSQEDRSGYTAFYRIFLASSANIDAKTCTLNSIPKQKVAELLLKAPEKGIGFPLYIVSDEPELLKRCIEYIPMEARLAIYRKKTLGNSSILTESFRKSKTAEAVFDSLSDNESFSIIFKEKWLLESNCCDILRKETSRYFDKPEDVVPLDQALQLHDKIMNKPMSPALNTYYEVAELYKLYQAHKPCTIKERFFKDPAYPIIKTLWHDIRACESRQKYQAVLTEFFETKSSDASAVKKEILKNIQQRPKLRDFNALKMKWLTLEQAEPEGETQQNQDTVSREDEDNSTQEELMAKCAY